MGDDATPEMLWPVGELGAAGTGDEVQVWCWSLHGEDAEAEELCRELSTEERARAGRFVFRRDWRRYVMAHAGVRRVLAAYLGRHGDALRLGQGEYGKPYLVGDEGLGFNLTHAGNVAALAVARGMEVGVDLERVVEGVEYPVEQLARREQAYLRGLPKEAVGMAFYRCWTRKEALLKGVGLGLKGELGEFSVLPEWDRADVAVGASAAIGGLAEWRLRELAPAVGYTGCLAAPVEGVPLRCFRLGEWA